MTEAAARTRVAPSPTGDPHVGTAYQALFDLAWARRTGGQFVLRIEDTDRARYSATSEDQIDDTLRWLGLTPDEGPREGGPVGPYRQSERLETYRPYVEQLIADGHAYRCWCTPERLAEMRQRQLDAKADVVGYDRLCYGLTEAERAKLPGFQPTPVVRMLVPDDVPLEFDDLAAGTLRAPRPDDQVILKADGFPTYHLAVVVDDHLMGITTVIRGQEWISSTPKHLLLYRWLGWEPPAFVHLPLLRDTNRSKISKRKSPWARLTWFREQGYLPEALLNFLMLMGYPPLHADTDVETLAEFAADLDWTKINPAGAVFDMDKLDWLNGHYIRALDVAELGERVVAFMRDFGGWADLSEQQADVVRRAIPIIRERMTSLAQAGPQLEFLFTADDAIEIADDARAQLKGDVPAILDASIAALADVEPFDHDAVEAALRAGLVDGLGLKPRVAFAPARVAVTGKRVSPPLFESLELLGREATLTRLRRLRESVAE